MACFGKIDNFNEANETWEHYTEQIGEYFEANDIANETANDKNKRRAILLSVCGSRVYKLMCDLLAPVKPKEKTFEDLVTLVKNHFNPKPSAIVQRLKFNNRSRQPGESVSSYVAALRNLTEHCEFNANLETSLRDRLVCGINDDRIQSKLLAEKELTFNKAFEIATSMETAAKNVKDIHAGQAQSTVGDPVHKVQHKSNKQSQNRQSSGAPSPQFRFEPCYRCGGNHNQSRCKHKDTVCYYCKKKGHLIEKCRNRKSKQHSSQQNDKAFQRSNFSRPTPSKVHVIESENTEEYPMYRIHTNSKDPYCVNVSINGSTVKMEIDTGASKTVIGENVYNQIHGNKTMQPSEAKLKTYTGEIIPIVGSCKLDIQYNGNSYRNMTAIVVKGTGPCLLGRDWLDKITLNWKEIFKITSDINDVELNKVLNEYDNVFDESLGLVRGVKAKLYIDENERPRYFKARPVAYSLRSKIETELDRLVSEGTVSPVEFSEWATPIVPIVKSDGSIRICGDYKITLNSISKLDNYPIPKTEDLYATLGGGTEFTKLDLSQAYQQLELDENSRKYTTINTHKGLFQYNRLPYGISSAPGIFQRTMENLLQGIPQVVVRVDDILVTGKNRKLHLGNVETVLSRLSEAGVHLKRDKCVFLAQEVVYLGHRINKDGIQPIPDKVRAIKDAPAPTNVKELQAFLGMLNYYACYLQNLSMTLAPLYELLGKDVIWKWDDQQINAFTAAKDMLKSSAVLVHYDPAKDLLVSCDASPYGVGAVLSHIMPNGDERPIAYASRSLAPAEKNYSQLEKESLSIIFAIKKFHQYVYGRHFTIETDHKPLLGLLQFDKPVPNMASARMQRWALLLSGYDYNLRYKQGELNSNADALSRLPLNETIANVPVPGEMILVMELLDSTPVTSEQISEWTLSDPILRQVSYYIRSGWPKKCHDEELRSYASRKTELSVHNGCVLWGNRVVVPKSGQSKLLSDLHESHPGIVRMKNLARSYIWWPGIDCDIEDTVQGCADCQLNVATPTRAPLHPWNWPDKPWLRIHIDYAGPFLGQMFLIVVDAYSKWLEVYPTSTATSTVTIEKLRIAFATHGLPETLVSDNGTCFTSAEFSEFMARNGISHVKSSPYHPSSNGLAERSVRIFKEGMKKMMNTPGSLSAKLSRFLLLYRNTPQSTTGVAPAELLFNRRLRTTLDLVKPEIRERVETKQVAQKMYHDQKSKLREFSQGDNVLVKNFVSGPKWNSAEIVDQRGPLSYTVKYDNGKVSKRHVDHIRQRHFISETQNTHEPEVTNSQLDSPKTSNSDSVVINDNDSACNDANVSNESTIPIVKPDVNSQDNIPVENQRPQRIKKEPSYLKDYVTT